MNGWKGVTFGSDGLHSALMWLTRTVDLRILYCISSLCVVPFSLLFNPSGRIIYRFYRRQFGYKPFKALCMSYRNHSLFGQVVIDRFAMYSGREFEVEKVGYEHFSSLEENPEKGFVQLSAHVGGYEIAGYTLRPLHKPMNALAFSGEKVGVMRNRKRMLERNHINVIEVDGGMDHIMELGRALQNREIVSLPADRLFGSSKSVRVRFFGTEVCLPLGPFAVAAMEGGGVLAVNAMKSSARRYTVHITPLEYDRSAPRRVQIRQLAEEYAAELERVVRLHPGQWFNFYDFFK